MRLPITALVGLAATLTVANIIVALPAGADAIEQDAAPETLPAGAALTGDAVQPHATLDGLDLHLVKREGGLVVELTNPSDNARDVTIRATASLSSGNAVSRMGPMTTHYAPKETELHVGAGETLIWPVNMNGGEPQMGMRPPMFINNVGRTAEAVPVIHVPPVILPTAQNAHTALNGDTINLPPSNVQPNNRSFSLSFATWSVDLSVGDKPNTSDRAILMMDAS